jgi:hypothetical protein
MHHEQVQKEESISKNKQVVKVGVFAMWRRQEGAEEEQQGAGKTPSSTVQKETKGACLPPHPPPPPPSPQSVSDASLSFLSQHF